MTVLFLNPTGQMGGAEVALVEALAGLMEERAGWTRPRVALIAGADGPLVSRARALGVDVHVLPLPPALARLGDWRARDERWSRAALVAACARAAWPVWRYRARLRAAVRALAPRILHTNGMKMHVLGAWVRSAGTPLIWHVHDYVTRRPLSARLLARYAHACAAIIAPSQSVADDVRRMGATLPPVHVIWNAVDLERFSPAGDALDLDRLCGLPPPAEGVVRVGLVATFARWKGHSTFLAAMARVPPTANVRFYIIGGPVYETVHSQTSIEDLRRAANRLGLAGRVGFTGLLGDTAPAMRALDVLVHASTDPEPFGLAVAEGMACGNAIVASLAGGVAEIVSPEVDALVHPPGDSARLADAVARLVADAGLRKRLGQAARTTAERGFDRRRLVDELHAVYDGVGLRDPLRVLHVHSGNLYGGVETFLATLARDAAVAPGMAPSFALCFDGRFSDELRSYGSRPYALGPVRLSRPHTLWHARRSMSRLLAAQRFDVVVCHQAWPHAIFGPTVRRAGLPLVFWQHTAGDGRHWLERWARRGVPDLAVANSEFTAGCLLRWFPGARVETIYYPLPPAAASAQDQGPRDAARRSLDTSLEHVVIAQAGRLEPLKGNLQALAALARLRHLKHWTYWIVGGAQRTSDRQYLRELEAFAQRAGIIDRVRFVGERSDVPALLHAADIYCQPNLAPEAFGIALVEAQGAGLPIVTSAFGGAREIVDATCGILVPPSDVEALAGALARLLADTDLRTRLGLGARVRAGTLCDLTRQMQRTHEVLSNVAPGRSRPAVPAAARALPSSVRP